MSAFEPGGLPPGPGLAIEAATAHVEVLACGPDGAVRAHEVEDVGHGHTRRLTPLVTRALAGAGLDARSLAWVAADLGPGSFTGVRVGLATAEALALAAGAALRGASSLAALALSCGAERALVVPLGPGGRHDVYAGFFRADTRGRVTLLAAPMVGPVEAVLAMSAEAGAALPGGWPVRFVGPGAAREREALERARPGATGPAWRFAGLSALDLAAAVRSGLGPAAGLPEPGRAPVPLYVRSAQAEERVRRAALAGRTIRLRDLAAADVPAAAAVERRVFSDPWPESCFHSELSQANAWARVAEQDGALAGYLLAWLGAGTGHVGNLAVVPEARRHGVARALLADLFERARAAGVARITLEVRAANFAAQALYRAHGFRLAGLRRGYYRDTGEDALVMAWQDPDAGDPSGADGPGGGAAPGPGGSAGPPSTSNPG
jgi:ribosomal-protein-alanine acetyltransferase/tRNA threonylcarbamoyl adenosine modification protein YeaZ